MSAAAGKDYNLAYDTRGGFPSSHGNGVVKTDALKSKASATAEMVRRAEDALIASIQRQQALDNVNHVSESQMRDKYPALKEHE